MSYTRLSDLTDSINNSFKEEFRRKLEDAIDKAITDYRNELPDKIAKVAGFLETQLIQRNDRPGHLDITFSIADSEEYRKALK